MQAQSYGSKARILMNVVETVADGEVVPSLTQISSAQPGASPRLPQPGVQASVPSSTPLTVIQSSTAPSSPLQLTKVTPSKTECYSLLSTRLP